MTLDNWARILVILSGAGWGATVILVWSSARVSEAALQERAFAGVILSSIATIFAVMAAVYLLDISLSGSTFTGLLILVAILSNVPQIIWVALLAMGRFR